MIGLIIIISRAPSASSPCMCVCLRDGCVDFLPARLRLGASEILVKMKYVPASFLPGLDSVRSRVQNRNYRAASVRFGRMRAERNLCLGPRGVMIVVKTKCLSKDSSLCEEEQVLRRLFFWVGSVFFGAFGFLVLDTWAPGGCGRKVIS